MAQLQSKREDWELITKSINSSASADSGTKKN